MSFMHGSPQAEHVSPVPWPQPLCSPSPLSLSPAMKVKVCIGLILTITATACLCRPAAEAPGAGGDPPRPPGSLVRRDWPEALSQEQKHLISRFLPHIFTELRDRKGYEGMEDLHDLYYPDWMDFGRRSAEDSTDAV
ncbi:gastrin/cholecystokinin-like peptide isoform X1 [Pezoporus occidentalis]|uniref:gastrin/cholecystokinin-like peptide isoform X1 n=2 Tax=Pezoporus occidentalis TaxID=407982 RepID=UPI002F90A971